MQRLFMLFACVFITRFFKPKAVVAASETVTNSKV
jgi:hypothetical protein